MDKLKIGFSAAGESHVADIGLAEWCAWEEETGRTMPSINGQNIGIRDLSILIYAWLKYRKRTKDSFTVWVQTLDDVEIITEADPKATPPEASEEP